MKLRFMMALCAFLFSADLLSNTQSAANKQQKDECIQKQRHRIVWMLVNDESSNAEPPTRYMRASRGYEKTWDQLEDQCDSRSHVTVRRVKQARSLQKLQRYGDEASLIRPGKRLGGTSPLRDHIAPRGR